jgi:hypothetical protein
MTAYTEVPDSKAQQALSGPGGAGSAWTAATGQAGQPVDLAAARGPATRARLNYPFAVAATADGGFLIADTYNYVVRKVAPIG